MPRAKSTLHRPTRDSITLRNHEFFADAFAQVFRLHHAWCVTPVWLGYRKVGGEASMRLAVSIFVGVRVFFDGDFAGEGAIDEGEVSGGQNHADHPPR
jgi:hypothetical protein